ncbi:MAG TPA: hypothetical protein VEY30_07105, partial [Myxococcaceae bacterium]|nr:hypothetical protein [Myxococcaceae bacterium]
DPRVVRMTENVLERALGHRRPPKALPPVQGSPPPSGPLTPKWYGQVSAVAGRAGVAGWADGPGSQALFRGPTGLALTAEGTIAVADTGNHRIRLIGADPARTVVTVAGNGEPGLRNGPGGQAMFRSPTGVAVGPDGVLYVADSDNHSIRRIARDGPAWTVTTYAGSLRQAGHVDGPAGLARFNRPTALTFDVSGNLYVADQAGQRIRKVVAGGGEVSTLAGAGGPGFTDAVAGASARFNNPSALAVSGDALYVFDAGNARLRRVELTAPYAVTTVAGGSPGFADGSGLQARFRAQMGLGSWSDGSLVVADSANFRLREVRPGADAASTQVWTAAGTGRVGRALGSSEAADLVAPAGLATAADGLGLALSDAHNHVVRWVAR